MLLDNPITAILVFILIYIYLNYWFFIAKALNLLLKRIFKGGQIMTEINDPWITKTIKKKIGILIETFTLIDEKMPFGTMHGFFKPHLSLSRGLYELLNRNELEWVLLHEAAHHKYKHPLMFAFVYLAFVFGGSIATYYLLTYFGWYMIPLLALFCGLATIQIHKIFERQADTFSINNVEDPRSVVTANEKFLGKHSASWWRKCVYGDNSFIRKYLHCNITVEERKGIVQKVLASRK